MFKEQDQILLNKQTLKSVLPSEVKNTIDSIKANNASGISIKLVKQFSPTTYSNY